MGMCNAALGKIKSKTGMGIPSSRRIFAAILSLHFKELLISVWISFVTRRLAVFTLNVTIRPPPCVSRFPRIVCATAGIPVRVSSALHRKDLQDRQVYYAHL